MPGSAPKMFEKALNSDADYFLDLEDAVSPNDKIAARKQIKAQRNWREKEKQYQ